MLSASGGSARGAHWGQSPSPIIGGLRARDKPPFHYCQEVYTPEAWTRPSKPPVPMISWPWTEIIRCSGPAWVNQWSRAAALIMVASSCYHGLRGRVRSSPINRWLLGRVPWNRTDGRACQAASAWESASIYVRTRCRKIDEDRISCDPDERATYAAVRWFNDALRQRRPSTAPYLLALSLRVSSTGWSCDFF